MTQKKYPSSTTSRTLTPAQRSLTTVVGKHDHRLSDADINLIQDLQDHKRNKVLDNMVFSGVLKHQPFRFNPSQERVFFIPAFEVMFNGEVVTIGGSKSRNLQENRIELPQPREWSYGMASNPASVYAVYLELWYRSLNPEDPANNTGYFVDTDGTRKIYANGCIECDPRNLIPDDVLDPFMPADLNNTTSRAQIQWAFRVQELPVDYDFNKHRFGLDPLGTSYDTIFGRGFLATPPDQTDIMKFRNLGEENGDYGLWRAGDGAEVPAIPTMDGYTYAMPVAVVFQRNAGIFDSVLNPHGCGDPSSADSGLLGSGLSGRYDFKYADVIYPEDVVDTRLTVSLTGQDTEKLLKAGFVDIIGGNIAQKIGRGESPGADSIVVGSKLPYTITISKSPVLNTDNLGSFDGFMNGFGSDVRTFYAVKPISIREKSVGSNGIRWTKGDSFTIDLDKTQVRMGVSITYVMVQALVQQDTHLAPVLLLGGQLNVTGLGTRKATVTLLRNLEGTAFDPATRDLLVTVGVTYEAGSNYSLKKIANSVAGGRLFDASVNKNYFCFGVSEYSTSRTLDDQLNKLTVFNPQYSNKIFGVRAEFVLPATSGVAEVYEGQNVLTFTLNRNDINNRFDGVFVVEVVNLATKQMYPISYMGTSPTTMVVKLPAAAIPSTATLKFSALLDQTAQLSYNPSVKAVSSIQETVLFGNFTSNAGFSMDPRVKLVSKYKEADQKTTLIFTTTDSSLTGVGGDSTKKFIFVADDPAHPTVFRAVPVTDVQFFNGVTTIIVPETVDIDVYPFFFAGSLAPAFTPDSSLALTLLYLPYQGEGDPNHTYTVLHSEEYALVTTNGTGAAPVVGLRDVFPFNRELPIVTTLPSQPTWNDAELANQAVSNYFDGNYQAKKFNNVEHTFMTPLHSNDFIEPIGGWKRKKLKLSFPSGRGFAKISPHVGFAIKAPKPKAVLGDALLSTVAPIQIFVNNVHGSDSLDGLTPTTPKKSIGAAIAALPPVLRHPCFIYLADTGTAYKMKDYTSSMKRVHLGDGSIVSSVHYCLGSFSHTLQDTGRIYIGRAPGVEGVVDISAEGFVGFGDGPSSAFVVTDTRVVFSGLRFRGFVNPAVYSVDSYVDIIDCEWENNFISGSFTDGSTVTVNGGHISLTNSGTGFILSNSTLLSSNVNLKTDNGNINAFYVCDRTSNLTLTGHYSSQEYQVSNVTPVVIAKLGSTVVCSKEFTSTGRATLVSNSVLTRTTHVTPFAGGITTDTSSTIMTDVS